MASAMRVEQNICIYIMQVYENSKFKSKNIIFSSLTLVVFCPKDHVGECRVEAEAPAVEDC